jgi:hypothetical protein
MRCGNLRGWSAADRHSREASSAPELSPAGSAGGTGSPNREASNGVPEGRAAPSAPPGEPPRGDGLAGWPVLNGWQALQRAALGSWLICAAWHRRQVARSSAGLGS